jgi:hypothetical protein
MAMGNQGEKGKMALLVQKVVSKNITLIRGRIWEENGVKTGEEIKRREMDARKKASPTRFIRRVNNPEKIED